MVVMDSASKNRVMASKLEVTASISRYMASKSRDTASKLKLGCEISTVLKTRSKYGNSL